MTSFKCYYIILIKIDIQLHAIIALLSDYVKRSIYRNTLTASYVTNPEGGGIKRFRGYVKNGFRDILVQFLNNNECPFISLPQHMNNSILRIKIIIVHFHYNTHWYTRLYTVS